MRNSLTNRFRFAGLAGLVLFAPDDGGAGGGTVTAGDSGDAGGAGSGGASLTAEQQAAVDAEVRRQLDAAVKPKLTAAQSKWEQDLKAFADAETQTAEEKANAAAKTARDEADAKIANADKRVIAAEARVVAIASKANPERVAALLKLADLSEVTVDESGEPDAKALKTAIDKALADFPEFKAGATTGGASGSEHQSGAATMTAEQFSKLSYVDRVKLRNEHPADYERLTAA